MRSLALSSASFFQLVQNELKCSLKCLSKRQERNLKADSFSQWKVEVESHVVVRIDLIKWIELERLSLVVLLHHFSHSIEVLLLGVLECNHWILHVICELRKQTENLASVGLAYRCRGASLL